MPTYNTPVTRLLGAKFPIIAAPMAFASTPELASEVTAAGGYGFIGAGFSSSAELKGFFAVARKRLGISAGSPVPIGVGFIGWILEMTEPSPDPRLNAVLDELPTAIWFAFGVDLGKYIKQVREYDAKRDHKTLIFVIVNSVEGALKAANEWKVDFIVAQGIEAGGHGGSESPPLFSLLPAVLRALPNGPPVVAAGGVSTGSQIAALLLIGAAGVVLGTRFLFTHECCYNEKMKQTLIDTSLSHRSTTRTLAYDEVGQTNGWPPLHDGRAITNDIISDAAEGLSLEERLARFNESTKSGSSSRLIIWAGVGAGMTDRLENASAVVDELFQECSKTLKSVDAVFS